MGPHSTALTGTSKRPAAFHIAVTKELHTIEYPSWYSPLYFQPSYSTIAIESARVIFLLSDSMASSEIFKPFVPKWKLIAYEKKTSVVFFSNFSMIEKTMGTNDLGNTLGQLSFGVSIHPYKKL